VSVYCESAYCNTLNGFNRIGERIFVRLFLKSKLTFSDDHVDPVLTRCSKFRFRCAISTRAQRAQFLFLRRSHVRNDSTRFEAKPLTFEFLKTRISFVPERRTTILLVSTTPRTPRRKPAPALQHSLKRSRRIINRFTRTRPV